MSISIHTFLEPFLPGAYSRQGTPAEGDLPGSDPEEIGISYKGAGRTEDRFEPSEAGMILLGSGRVLGAANALPGQGDMGEEGTAGVSAAGGTAVCSICGEAHPTAEHPVVGPEGERPGSTQMQDLAASDLHPVAAPPHEEAAEGAILAGKSEDGQPGATQVRVPDLGPISEASGKEAPPGGIPSAPASLEGIEKGEATGAKGNDEDEEEASGAGSQELTEEEKAEVQRLKERDQEVRAHEQAHMAAGGQYVRGGASYEYESGPDGHQYAVGGEVQIDTSKVSGDPQATIQKAQVVRRAAMAPAQPSPQDRRVASAASRMGAEARQEAAKARMEGGDGEEGPEGIAGDSEEKAEVGRPDEAGGTKVAAFEREDGDIRSPGDTAESDPARGVTASMLGGVERAEPGKGMGFDLTGGAVPEGFDRIEPAEGAASDLTGGISDLVPGGLGDLAPRGLDGVEPGGGIGEIGKAVGKDIAPEASASPSPAGPTVSRLDAYTAAMNPGQLVDVYR